MREILFRAKCKLKGKWMYGSYRLSGGKHYINSTEIHRETLGQYTGLTDKNGTKIFEGDRFEYGYVATWVDESSNGSHGMFAGWYLQRDDFESWEELSVGYSYEVIGNIHEKGK